MRRSPFLFRHAANKLAGLREIAPSLLDLTSDEKTVYDAGTRWLFIQSLKLRGDFAEASRQETALLLGILVESQYSPFDSLRWRRQREMWSFSSSMRGHPGGSIAPATPVQYHFSRSLFRSGQVVSP